jgi:hypothetical protein
MVNVLKASGEKEPFSEEKIRYSIKRAGISQNIQDKVVSHVKSKLYENIPTSQVYEHITEFLKNEPHPARAKYGLKRAIMELGPTGYPFEDLVSEILKSKGYVTQVGSILTGRCVNHEIDVIAEKQGTEKIMVEVKFHNEPGIHTDVHVPLYTKARFDDLKEKYKFDRPWLFTNTKVTPDALSYALCVNMGVVGWNYPQNEGLRDLIEHANLYPLTILASLSQPQKQLLLDNHVVTIGEILKNTDCLSILGVQTQKKDAIIKEAKSISA